MNKAQEIMEKRKEISKAMSEINQDLRLTINTDHHLELHSSDTIKLVKHSHPKEEYNIDKKDALKMAKWITEMFRDQK